MKDLIWYKFEANNRKKMLF